MKTLTIEEFRTHIDDFLSASTEDAVVLTRDGHPCVILNVKPIREPDDDYSAALARSADFWKMIQERRQEPTISWEEAKKDWELEE